ncbi:MAG: hypothetical protein COT85_02580 [Chlamydiae bacterium CG10_big_fil_rev_8_21_14_0_10_42_34]|nr:MAG: hypothetical protein COT85_02580 [Chlamydiae bacterium CG10_big_fil_rev_8_21_14_0_10_42_34]
MATLVGGMLVCGGTLQALATISDGPSKICNLKMQGKSRAEIIAKVAGHILAHAGVFAMCIGSIIAGAIIYNGAASALFLPVFHEAIKQSALWIAGGFAAFGTGVCLVNLADAPASQGSH